MSGASEVTLTAGWVADWARLYEARRMGSRERLALEAGAEARERGHYTLELAEHVVRWKSHRALGHFGRNPRADVVAVSTLAFAAPEHLRHRVLGLLDGVGDGVAGALLTAWDPTAWTMYDWRAWDSLERLPGGIERARELPYWRYVERSRALAAELGVGLRDLDRALWEWSKAGHPA